MSSPCGASGCTEHSDETGGAVPGPAVTVVTRANPSSRGDEPAGRCRELWSRRASAPLAQQADERVRGGIGVVLRCLVAPQLRRELCGHHLAELDPPLVEGVAAPV